MTERVRFIQHKGKEILLIDFSSGTAQEVLAAMSEAQRVIGGRPFGSVRTLTDVTDGRYDRDVTESLKAYVAHNKPYVVAGAVVGLNDLKTILFNFLNRFTGRTLRAMENTDSAKDWLATF
jgi:hypothetical protein